MQLYLAMDIRDLLQLHIYDRSRKIKTLSTITRLSLFLSLKTS